MFVKPASLIKLGCAVAVSASVFAISPTGISTEASAQPLTRQTASLSNRSNRAITMIPLLRGKRYKVRVSNATHFGTWRPTRRALKNDACYEFNSGRGRVSLPVVKSSHHLNFCGRGYRANHKYESQIIYGDGRPLQMWVYDTDYRDNYGSYYVEVILMR